MRTITIPRPRSLAPWAALGLIAALSGGARAADLDACARLIEDGWSEQARTELAEVVAREDVNARAHFLYAKAGVRLGDYEAADKHSRLAVELEPDNATYQILRGDAVGLRARHGSKLKAIGRAKQCIAAYNRAVQLEPDNMSARFSVFQFNRLAPGYAGGDKNAARAQLPEIARIDSLRGYFCRALWAEQEDADPQAAEQELLGAIAAYSDRPEPYDEYALFLLRHDRSDSAVAWFRRGLDRHQDKADAHEQLGRLLTNLGRHEEAAAELAAAVAADPARLSAVIAGSVNLQDQERWAEALQVLDELERAHPDYGLARYQRGRAHLLAAKDYEAAEEAFRAYLEGPINTRWPSRAHGHWRLALALEKQGHLEEAYEEIRAAVELNPQEDSFEKMEDRLAYLGRDEF